MKYSLDASEVSVILILHATVLGTARERKRGRRRQVTRALELNVFF